MSDPVTSFSVDIVIPVFNASDDVRRCIESVLAHDHADCRITVIDDASPDPEIAALFTELAARHLPQLSLLRNERNLGFIGTANRGMQDSRADVVLLNSDTIVTGEWLRALRRCAAADARIGTITPFSNNAEICSFPRFCEDNTLGHMRDGEAVSEALAAAAVPTYPDLPTGVGFCLYVRRALIDAIGTFDPIFGPGYGEENDFCMRAAEAGFRNVLCDDAFVIHLGGRSFRGQKAELGTRNMALLLERHPQYLDIVYAYIAADPLRPIRDAAMAKLRVQTGPEHGVLHVIHGHGGGTEHHARALIDTSRGAYRHYLVIAVGDDWQLEEHLEDGGVRTFNFRRHSDESWHTFLGGLCALFRIGLIHLHNISGNREAFISSIDTLGVPYGYTVHDLNFACPTITFLGPDEMYCGAQTDPDICRNCLAVQPEFEHVDIVAWRESHGALVAGAAFLIAPSRWAADTFMRYFPDRAVEVIAHGAPGVWAAQDASRDDAEGSGVYSPRLAVVLPDDDMPSVAVLGAVGPDKGARRVERMVELVRERGSCVRFVLIGYLDRQHTAWQSDDAVFTVHGVYKPRDLPDLLAHYRVRLVAYPSAGPETFSFTLSEAWAAARPVIVPPFGALAERVSGTGAGWIWTEDEWRDEKKMLDRILQVLAPEFGAELDDASRRAKRCPQPMLTTMAQSTLRLYDRALAASPIDVSNTLPQALDAARVRDALGYVPWTPPPVASSGQSSHLAATDPTTLPDTPHAGMAAQLSRLALRVRHTGPGRVLHRLTPTALLDALKARLF